MDDTLPASTQSLAVTGYLEDGRPYLERGGVKHVFPKDTPPDAIERWVGKQTAKEAALAAGAAPEVPVEEAYGATTFRFPAGTTQAQIDRWKATHGQKYLTQNEQPSFVEADIPEGLTEEELSTGRLRALASGAAFTAADELEAMFRSGQISGDQYRAERNRIRDEQARYSGLNPAESYALEFTGGMVPGALTGGGALLATGRRALPGVLNAVTQAAGRVPQWARLPAIAGAAGALSGAGAAPEMEDIPLYSATTGALSAAIPLGLQAIPPVARGLRNVARGFFPPSAAQAERTAQDIIVNAMRRDRTAPQDVVNIMRERERLDVPTLMGETGGRQMRALTQRVATAPTTESSALLSQLEAMHAGAGPRVRGRVAERFGESTDYDTARQSVSDEMRDIFENEYAPAYAVGEINDPTINQRIRTNLLAPFWKDVKEGMEAMAEAEGRDPSTAFRLKMEPVLDAQGNLVGLKPEGGVIPDVESLDMLKKVIDEKTEALWRSGAINRQQADALGQIRNTIVSRLDTLVPEYAAARANYRGAAEVRSAFDIGMGTNLRRGQQSVEKMRVSQLERMLADPTLSTAERRALRIGYANSIVGKLGGARNGNRAASIVNDPDRLAKFRLLFDDPNEFNVMEAALRAEAENFGRRSAIIGGSRTEPMRIAGEDIARQMGEGDVDVARGVLPQLARRNWAGAADAALRAMRGHNYPEAVYDALARALRAGDSQAVEDFMTDLVQRSAQLGERARRGRAAGAVGATAVGAAQGPGPEYGAGEEYGTDVNFAPIMGPEDTGPEDNAEPTVGSGALGLTPLEQAFGKGAHMSEEGRVIDADGNEVSPDIVRQVLGGQ